MKGHAAIRSFNHGVLDLTENGALGLGIFRKNTPGCAFGVLTSKASPSGWVFSQAQHRMIKTYNNARWRNNTLQVMLQLSTLQGMVFNGLVSK